MDFEGNQAGHAEEVALRRSPEQKLDPAEIAFFGDLQRLLLREKVSLPRGVSKICAVDAAYQGDRVVAVASLFDHGRLKEASSYSGSCSLPYQSGLFYLREGPFVVQSVRKLKARPQLVCFDAHGAAHPRFSGLATIAGMVLGIPSIGIAKSLLAGAPIQTKSLERIAYRGRTVGFVTRTNGIRRYWSPGYAVNIRELASLIRNHAQSCLSAMLHSHETATERIRLLGATMNRPPSRGGHSLGLGGFAV
jgi:deoxyribonuclease V